MSYKPTSYSGFCPVGVPFDPTDYVNFMATNANTLIPVGMESLSVGTGSVVSCTASKYSVSGILADKAYITLESGNARFSARGDITPLTSGNGTKLQVSSSGTSFYEIQTDISQLRFLAVGGDTTVNLQYFKVGQ